MSTASVRARPVRTAKWFWTAAAVVLVVFVVTAILEPRFNAGATFDVKDQLGTALVGVVVAMLLVMPTYPRLDADTEMVRIRSFLGDYREIPWSVIVDVRFPRKVRFAQLVLPGDETLAIYAIQRWDGEYAVRAMDGLRALLAATRPASSR